MTPRQGSAGRYLDQDQASEYLAERGLPIAPKTLGKLRTVGGGPLYRKFGRKPIYAPVDLDIWADEKLGTPGARRAKRPDFAGCRRPVMGGLPTETGPAGRLENTPPDPRLQIGRAPSQRTLARRQHKPLLRGTQTRAHPGSSPSAPCRAAAEAVLTPAAAAEFDAEIAAFCERILEINSTFDFRVSSRGWAYLLEGEGVGSRRADFDAAQNFIPTIAASRELFPLNICSEDNRRAGEGVEYLDGEAQRAPQRHPDPPRAKNTSSIRRLVFWDPLDVYVEMAVEKGDLKGLFAPVCRRIPNGDYEHRRLGGPALPRSHDAPVRGARSRRSPGRAAVLRRPRSGRSQYLKHAPCEPGGDGGALRTVIPIGLVIDRFGLNFDFIEANRAHLDRQPRNWQRQSASTIRSTPTTGNCMSSRICRGSGRARSKGNALVTRVLAARDLCRQAIVKYVPAFAPAAYTARLAVLRAELRAAIRERLDGAAP